MSVSATDDARELIRFLITNAGHPIVLDRNDCALLAERIERAEILEGELRNSRLKPSRQELAPLAT
jgi:hypothetical protein